MLFCYQNNKSKEHVDATLMESGTRQRGVNTDVAVLWRNVMSHHYISLENAKQELVARACLRQSVVQYWERKGLQFPLEIREGQYCSVFARQIAAFRFEDAQFILMSERAGLVPSWLPYTADKFVTRSALKRSYIMPLLARRYGRNGGLVTEYANIVAKADGCSGKRLNEIVTTDNRMLCTWHKDRLLQAYPQASVFDEGAYASPWATLSTSDRYEAFLSFFVAHSVLFEDYHGGESGSALDAFTPTVFEPAFDRVCKRFGVAPLIVAVPWKAEFSYYPDGELMDTWRSVPFLND